MENYGKNRTPNIGILSCVFITGYKIYRVRCEQLWHSKSLFARQKSTLWIKQKKNKPNFDIDKTFRALKMIALSFSSYQIEKRLNADYTLSAKLIERFWD